jgi:hypothetical protein
MGSIMWRLARCVPATLALALLVSSPATLAQRMSRRDASRVAAHAKRCRAPKHHKVLVNTRDLVMWSVERYSGEFEEEFVDTLFACVPPRGRTHIIGAAGQGPAVQAGSSVGFESAGSFVAIDEAAGNSVGFTETLTLHDARDGRTTEIVSFAGENSPLPIPAPESLEALGPPVGVGIREYAVDANGDVAWVGYSAAAAGKAGVRVLYVDDASGIHRVAATTTLELVGFRRGQVRWTESARA